MLNKIETLNDDDHGALASSGKTAIAVKLIKESVTNESANCFSFFLRIAGEHRR